MSGEPKTYVNAFTKIVKKEFPDGGIALNIGINSQRMREFLDAHTNERGFCNIVIATRKQTDQYGNTHCAYKDTFQPKPQSGQPTRSSAPKDSEPPKQQQDDACPF